MPRNRLIDLLFLIALPLQLVACAATKQPPPPADVSGVTVVEHVVARGAQPQMQFRLASGVYRCDLGARVEIQRDARDSNLIEINWKGNRHTLRRYDSTSGLPRYEDRQNGLLWIDLPWKSVLMDVKSGHPLANECKAKG